MFMTYQMTIRYKVAKECERNSKGPHNILLVLPIWQINEILNDLFEFGLVGVVLGGLLLLEDRNEGDGTNDEDTAQQRQHLQTQSQLKQK